jgi:hypothetical protein
MSASRLAVASEAHDPRCEGFYSLWSPLPDDCLETIDTDRPHQTDTPHVVPAGHLQLESAVGALAIGEGSKHLVFLENAYRVGLFTRIEFQLTFKLLDYVPDAHRFDPPGPLGVRAKLNILEEDGWVPAVTIVPWIFIPVSSSETLRGGPFLFWGWALPFDLELEMNAGVLFGADPKPPAALVLASALTYTIGGAFRVFIDIYATGRDVALGTGALWAFEEDMQIDAGTYIGVHGEEPTATPFLGFSIRR